MRLVRLVQLQTLLAAMGLLQKREAVGPRLKVLVRTTHALRPTTGAICPAADA